MVCCNTDEDANPSSESTKKAEEREKQHPDNKILVHEGWKSLKEKPRL
jgi:hypothetical protein